MKETEFGIDTGQSADGKFILDMQKAALFKVEKPKLLLHMEKELVLKVMKEAGKPIAAGEVAALSGLDRKIVDKVFAELKKEGAIVSPVRCKWTPAE